MPEFAQPGLRERPPAPVGGLVEDEPAAFEILSPAAAPPPELSPSPALPVDLDLRARIHQALVCPYCRDEVERAVESVGCVRDGCGAIYHSECWEECRADHGSCAVFGCSSTRAQPLSATGYVLRVLRLLTAALLLPPRLVAAVEERDGGEGLGRQIARLTARALPSLDPSDDGFTKLAAYLTTSCMLAFAVIPLLQHLLPPGFPPAMLVLAIPPLVLLGTLILPGLVAGVSISAFCLARALVLGLKGERAALERAGGAPVKAPK